MAMRREEREFLQAIRAREETLSSAKIARYACAYAVIRRAHRHAVDASTVQRGDTPSACVQRLHTALYGAIHSLYYGPRATPQRIPFYYIETNKDQNLSF
jgi:hypothetical protein